MPLLAWFLLTGGSNGRRGWLVSLHTALSSSVWRQVLCSGGTVI
jgi:hypothetical protein